MNFEVNFSGLFSFFYSVFKNSLENQAAMLKSFRKIMELKLQHWSASWEKLTAFVEKW